MQDNVIHTDIRTNIRKKIRTDIWTKIWKDIRTDIRTEIRTDIRTDIRPDIRTYLGHTDRESLYKPSVICKYYLEILELVVCKHLVEDVVSDRAVQAKLKLSEHRFTFS